MDQDRARLAIFVETDLREKVLPYWRATMDRERGGYAVPEIFPTRLSRLRGAAGDLKRRLTRDRRPPLPGPHQRHLVNQARLTWMFSYAHRLGYGDREHDYLDAARCGYRFLTERLLDRRHGGFAWLADPGGRILDPRKVLYGQAFALYALVEYHRAGGGVEALDHARSLFERIQHRMHDPMNTGWLEHCAADFTPLPPHVEVQGMPMTGMKGANTHLHWMEALSEFAEASGEAEARSALEEAIHVNSTWFFPRDPGEYREFRRPDWRAAEGSGPDLVSYGHNMEFAWLMIRAQEVLGVSPDWERFENLLRHALRFGFDPEKGGFYWLGPGAGPAVARHKVWWVQAEGLAALTRVVRHRPDEDYERALDLLLRWIVRGQRLPGGLWSPSIDVRGRRRPIRAHGAFKAAYHEVRGMAMFVEAFSSTRSG